MSSVAQKDFVQPEGHFGACLFDLHGPKVKDFFLQNTATIGPNMQKIICKKKKKSDP